MAEPQQKRADEPPARATRSDDAAPPEPASPAADERTRGAPRASARPRGSAPVLWALGGVALTLLIVVTLRWTDRSGLPPAAPSPPPTGAKAAATQPAEPGSSREQFAELYLSYLLKTYYIEDRGFCPALLRKVCLALHHADLLADARDCETVPNDELVLAIGRYQHRVGLPVDGKAGPETVRMMLGGDFSNRRGMVETYCRVALPADSAETAPAAPR